MIPTIEDVLKKHGFIYEQKSYTVDSFALYDAAKAAMTEWASLQTPSNEKYWRERCEAAEAYIGYTEVETFIKSSSDQFQWENYLEGKMKSKKTWQELKSTPIPLTPCVELEKEVERLKGLIWEMYGDIGTALNITDEFIEKEKNNFKAKHNL